MKKITFYSIFLQIRNNICYTLKKGEKTGGVCMNIKGIAEKTGFSVATVSRVLNGKTNVNPATRDKIMQAVRDYGYDKKILEKNQSLLKNNIVIVLLRNIHKPFLQELLYAFQKFGTEYDFEVMFYSNIVDGFTSQALNQILRTVKGIVAFSSNMTDFQAMKSLENEKIPMVIIDNFFQDINVNTLLVKNKEASCEVVDYLVRLNHTRIACLAGLPNLKVWVERVNGYTEAMRKWNLFIYKEYIQYCEEEEMGVREAIDCLLNMDITIRPTAIYCFNDAVAFMAIEYLQSLGVRVPEDISVVGFDCQGTAPKNYIGPILTSVRQPFEQLAKDSLEIIAKELAYESKIEEPICRYYDTELFIGGSTCYHKK